MTDPQDVQEIGHCSQCGGEIYPLELVRIIDQTVIHDECAMAYLDDIAPLCMAEDVM